MMKAFTSNFGPVKVIKNSYDKNYYIYRADETNTNNYLDFSKSKDYIEGWLSGAIKAKNNVISSKTESLQEAESKQSLDDIARYLLDWDGYYEENFEEWDSEWDFVKDLTEDIQENFHLSNKDAQTVARKMYKMLQSKLEEDVHKQRIPTSELPDFCYSYNDTTGEIIVIKKGVEGYYPSNIKLDDTLTGNERKQQAEELIKEQNEILGVTDDQRLQMELNSMFGWDDTKTENKKLNELAQQFIIGLTNKTIKELVNNEIYDSYVKDIRDSDNVYGIEVDLTDNKEEALRFDNKTDAEIAASEIEQIQDTFQTVIVIAL